MFNFLKRKPKITKEEAQAEINRMIEIYNNPMTNYMMNPDSKGWYAGFLYGSSICGNNGPGGDSARFEYLKSIIEK